MAVMTTEELTGLNRRNGDNFLKLACGPWPDAFGGTDWLVWLFHNEARMIGREWARAWARQGAERAQDRIDFGYHKG